MRIPIIAFEVFAGASADDPNRIVAATVATEPAANSMVALALQQHQAGRILFRDDADPAHCAPMPSGASC